MPKPTMVSWNSPDLFRIPHVSVSRTPVFPQPDPEAAARSSAVSFDAPQLFLTEHAAVVRDPGGGDANVFSRQLAAWKAPFEFPATYLVPAEVPPAMRREKEITNRWRKRDALGDTGNDTRRYQQTLEQVTLAQRAEHKAAVAQAARYQQQQWRPRSSDNGGGAAQRPRPSTAGSVPSTRHGGGGGGGGGGSSHRGSSSSSSSSRRPATASASPGPVTPGHTQPLTPSTPYGDRRKQQRSRSAARPPPRHTADGGAPAAVVPGAPMDLVALASQPGAWAKDAGSWPAWGGRPAGAQSHLQTELAAQQRMMKGRPRDPRNDVDPRNAAAGVAATRADKDQYVYASQRWLPWPNLQRTTHKDVYRGGNGTPRAPGGGVVMRQRRPASRGGGSARVPGGSSGNQQDAATTAPRPRSAPTRHMRAAKLRAAELADQRAAVRELGQYL